ncbi:serine/threonine-protein kinase 33 isoform X1 [Hydra vulgaris]|nr:serine/threonine-protein kinase 33 [Hydra vulgaris]
MISRRLRASIDATRNIKHTRIKNEQDIESEYKFMTLLGKGSFGTVSEAIRLYDQTGWAIKVINKEKAGSVGVKLLEREVLIMKMVNHPHIIHLEEVFETSHKMFLVMELCLQGALESLLKKVTYFEEKDVLCIFTQLADAIDYIHSNDIIHRDLKLENILLAPQFESYNIKLTDFGLSYTRGGSGSDYMMNQVVGTPIYMAPEVITRYDYSQQCDIWSAGVIMYKLLCGEPPFMASNEEELFILIQKGELKFEKEKWKSVSPSAKHLLEGMLKVDPAHRITSKEILCHPWIKGDETVDKYATNVLEMMKEYNREQKLLNSSGINGGSSDISVHSSISSQITVSSETKDSQISLKPLDRGKRNSLTGNVLYGKSTRSPKVSHSRGVTKKE